MAGRTLVGIVAMAAVACGAAPGAFAQSGPTTKLYAGVDAGISKIGVSQYAFGVPAGPRDNQSPVFRVRAGYQFVRFFALEAGYADLGSYSASIHMDCSASPDVQCVPDFASEIDLRAWTINAAAVLPIGDRITVRGNSGLALREKKTHQVPANGAGYRRSATKVLPFLGVGAGFAVTRKFEVIAEWNKFVGDDPGYGRGGPAPPGSLVDEADSEAFSLGVRFRF